MIRRPPRSTRTDTLFPYTTLFRSTNVNDILHRALSAGDYSVGGITPTPSPSMDIQVSSNFERLLFDVGGRDGAALAEQTRGVDASTALRLTNAQTAAAAAWFARARIALHHRALELRRPRHQPR